MPGKVLVFFISLFLFARQASAQKPLPVDSSFEDYDVLFREMDSFFDSLLRPRSYLLINVGLTNGYFNTSSKTNSGISLQATRKLTYSPSITWFHKSGLGLSASSSIVQDSGRLNPFLFVGTVSYDYVKSTKLITGISFSHFFTKDSLSFYTSPLENELYVYFTYRDFWLKPSIGINYGWGSRTEYTERQDYITFLRLRRRGYTTVNTRESVSDLTVTASLRKDFYWLDVVSDNDFIRFTPQLAFVSGTQKFGFNQTTTTTYGKGRINGANPLNNTENVQLNDEMAFQPLSASAILKTEFSKGKFFLQPQLIFDYYIPAKEKNFSTMFTVNTGFIF